MAFLRLTSLPLDAVILQRKKSHGQIMTQINAYLNFSGNCREALSFYHECIGGELEMQTIGGSPVEAQCPAAMKDQILHGSLTKGTLVLMGSDMVGPDGIMRGNNISLALSCSSEQEIDHFYNNLAKGGEMVHPLQKEFWGATFGIVHDKFGIRWMLTYDEKIQRN